MWFGKCCSVEWFFFWKNDYYSNKKNYGWYEQQQQQEKKWNTILKFYSWKVKIHKSIVIEKKISFSDSNLSTTTTTLWSSLCVYGLEQ